MRFDRPWLEITEYLLVLMTLMGLILTVIKSEPLYVIFPLVITGMLNLINRIRSHHLLQAKLARKIDQNQRQLAEHINILEQKINLIEAKLSLLYQPHQNSENLPEKIEIIQQSLNNVIQYLHQASFTERVDKLESFLAQSFSFPDPKTPVVIKQDKPSLSISIPKAPHWQQKYIFDSHSDGITALAISPDGEFLASGSWDETLKIWSLSSGNLILSSEIKHQGLLAITFTEIINHNTSLLFYTLATGGFDQNIYIWQFSPATAELSILHNLTGHLGSIRTLKIANSEPILVSGSYDQTIKQWNLDNYTLSHSCYDPLGDIHSLAIFNNHQLIAGAGGDGRITIWQLGDGRKIKLLTGNIYSIESLAISQDEKVIAGGCIDGKIRFWFWENSPQSSELISLCSAHSGPVIFLQFDPKQNLLYSGGADGKVKIWYLDYENLNSLRCQLLTTLEINDESDSYFHRVLAVVLSPNRRYLVVGTVDGIIKVFTLTIS